VPELIIILLLSIFAARPNSGLGLRLGVLLKFKFDLRLKLFKLNNLEFKLTT